MTTAMKKNMSKIKEELLKQKEYLKNSCFNSQDRENIIFGENDLVEKYSTDESELEKLRDFQHEMLNELKDGDQ